MLLRFVRKILYAYRKRVIRKQFAKHSVFSKDLLLFDRASCINSGDPQNIIIANHCTIGASFVALCGGKITIGENTYIGPHTCIQAKEKISIGKNVMIANNVLLVDNNNHPTAPEERMKMSQCDDFLNDELWSWKYAESKPIIIEDNV